MTIWLKQYEEHIISLKSMPNLFKTLQVQENPYSSQKTLQFPKKRNCKVCVNFAFVFVVLLFL